MRAVQVTTLEGPEHVAVAEVEAPTPGPGQVVIEVSHAGVTFPELLQTRGMYQVKHPLPFTLGSEAAGIVSAVGEGSRFSVGDRVATITGKGTFAEFLLANDEQVLLLPDSLSLEAAAGIPMNVLTADFTLRVRANLQPGRTLLVHGAAGGLGSALVQLGLAMGAEVVAVVSTEEKAQVVRGLGAQHVVFADGFKDAVLEIFPDGVDFVADPVGGDRFTDSIRSLRRYGQVLVLGFTAGEIPTVKVNRLLLKNVAVSGVAWGEATRDDRNLIHSQWEAITDHLASGALDPHIHGHYPLERAAEAIAVLDERAVLGKVLLDVNPSLT